MVRLSAAHIDLREIVESDWPAVHAYGSDPEVVKFELWGPNTEAESRDFVARCLRAQAEEARRSFELAVTLRDGGQLIGAAGVRLLSAEHSEAEIGYAFARAHWGRGLATEAARALLAFGFGELGLHRISATCHAANLASARVLEKIGMRREGTLRQNRLQRGAWRDSHLYAILAGDFSAR